MANVNFRLTIYQIGKANWNKAVPDTKSGFYLGFTVWGRRREWQKAMSFLGGSKGMPPGNFLKWICAEMQSGAFWDTILRNVTVSALPSPRPDDFSDIVTYIL